MVRRKLPEFKKGGLYYIYYKSTYKTKVKTLFLLENIVYHFREDWDNYDRKTLYVTVLATTSILFREHEEFSVGNSALKAIQVLKEVPETDLPLYFSYPNVSPKIMDYFRKET
jgi:hypothetical protein